MPERVLRPGILTSDRVNSLDWESEVFYRRLMSVVDDFGRFDARLSILRANLYPLLLDRVRESNVQRSLAECEAAGLVRLYCVAGRQYVELLDFRQRMRASQSKYPPPPDNCGHPHADAGQPQAIDSSPPSSARGRMTMPSETETETETKTEAGDDARGRARPAPGGFQRQPFVPPTRAEVDAYGAIIGMNPADTELFWLNYEAKCWRIGGDEVGNWKALQTKWKVKNEQDRHIAGRAFGGHQRKTEAERRRDSRDPELNGARPAQPGDHDFEPFA